MSVATVLLADDDALVRDGLQVLIGLEPDLQVCATAGNGRTALEHARQHHPDIALLDIRMPEMDGIECCRAIKQELPATRILILTTFHDDELIHQAMQAGADGYLLKHQPSAVMIDGIRAVLHGNVILEPSVARSLAAGRQAAPGAAAATAAAAVGITGRELEVLQLIAEGLSNQEIADRIFLSTGTIRNYVSSLLEKLDLRDRTQLAVWYYQQAR
ncbi:response regulator [Spirochaeta africana]|uniref:Response regulator containing a CheY-like receiver domain and an HTH DNA-binding domain n=1 Tax=Spirochaeta africana (strain ATCC 700263 / DSM 8902 / Z-7692) TaxID=889378 RepID=H9UG89_SPIAZ|nr:response regulator transcription factor [Spirochaeta africana]AFG36532.1 response regulator containing a CheY-like receiver domain and an HTH DNA-binding domain [Spirochaeta africana DSM 8902]